MVSIKISSCDNFWQGCGILLVKMQIGVATVENVMEVPQETKNRSTMWPINSAPGYIFEKMKALIWNSSIIYNSHDMEAI